MPTVPEAGSLIVSDTGRRSTDLGALAQRTATVAAMVSGFLAVLGSIIFASAALTGLDAHLPV